MHVLVTGSSGLIGSALTAALRADGHTVTRLVRRAPAAADERRWEPGGHVDARAVDEADAVVHLAGEGIGERRWTESHKARILESRVAGTTTIATALASASRKERVLVSSSGINYYGYDRDDEELDETSPPGDGFMAEVCRQWEAATGPAADAGVRVVRLRTGIVLSAGGGALARQLPFFRLGIGGPLGRGRSWWSWITLEDHVALIRHALQTPTLTGPVNATAPNPARNRDVAAALGRALGRPAAVPAPPLGPLLLFGREMTREVVFVNLKVHPARALGSGYVFRHPTIEGAMRAVFER